MALYLTSILYIDDIYVDKTKICTFFVANTVPGVASIILKFIYIKV